MSETPEEKTKDLTPVEIWNAFGVVHAKWKPWYKFIVVDCPQFMAMTVLERHGVHPAIITVLSESDSCKYMMLTVRIRKKHLGPFLEAMEELQRDMLICGYTNYPDFCRELITDSDDEEGDADDSE